MALMKCPECNHEVSDKAATCPNCGFGIQEYVNTLEEIVLCPMCGSSGDLHSNGICCVCNVEVVNTHKKYSYKDGFSNKISKRNEAFEEIKSLGLYDPEKRKIQQMIFRGTYTEDPTPEESEITDKYRSKLVEMRRRDGFYDKIKQSQSQPKKITIKCPICGSTNTKRITATSRVTGVLTLGLASGKIGKQYKCKNCRHMW